MKSSMLWSFWHFWTEIKWLLHNTYVLHHIYIFIRVGSPKPSIHPLLLRHLQEMILTFNIKISKGLFLDKVAPKLCLFWDFVHLQVWSFLERNCHHFIKEKLLSDGWKTTPQHLHRYPRSGESNRTEMQCRHRRHETCASPSLQEALNGHHHQRLNILWNTSLPVLDKVLCQ